jgi:MFS transporter
MSTAPPITLREKLIFGSGDIFIGGSQVIMAFYYLRFLTDAIQISPALADTVALVSKVWDAISDPVMGVITDNTRARWGRRAGLLRHHQLVHHAVVPGGLRSGLPPRNFWRSATPVECGPVRFGTSLPGRVLHRRHSQDLDYLRFDSPYVQAPGKPGMISITRDDKSLQLDFYGLKREVGDAD